MHAVVLTHGDVDGITSGAIGLLAFPGADLYFTRPSQIHTDLYRVARDRPDVVSVSDIALNVMRFDDIMRALSRFPKETTIHWTDHHPMATKYKRRLSQRVEMFHQIGPCAAELMYRKFADRLPEHALHLALYGAIADYCDNTPFVRRHFEDFDKRTLYLEAGLLVQALQEIDYRRESKDLTWELTLGIEPSSMNNIVDLAMKATRVEHEVFRYVQSHARKVGPVGYVLDMPVHGYRGKSAKFAAYLTDSVIGISARSSEDEVDVSIRRRNSKIDLNRLLARVIPRLTDAQGGGHPAACGASMRRSDFPRFLQLIGAEVAAQSS
ncbi:MAG: DHHA1 domain-containing protein [Candidatus Thorarchaeota archaeon]